MVTIPKNRKKSAKKAQNSQERAIDLKGALQAQREKKLKKQKLTAFWGFALAWAIFLGLPLGFLFGPLIGLGVGLGLPFCVFCFLYPRTALWIFLIYMPFSGTLTYWVAAGNAAFQLAKDVIYIPALIGMIWQCRQKKLPLLIGPKSLHLTLQILIVCTLLTFTVINTSLQLVPECEPGVYLGCRSSGTPLAQGLIGFKVLLGYIPLIFCTYYLIESKKDLLNLSRLLVMLCIICCALGLVQYWYLYTGRCQGTVNLTGEDLYRASLDARCLVGGSLIYSPNVGAIRLPGTFVSPWHWGWFLVGNAGICFAGVFSETSKTWKLISLIGLALVVTNAIICGQRLAFLAVPALIIILLILTGKLANLKQFIPTFIGLFLLVSISFSFFNPEFIQQRVDSFVDRWNHSPPYALILEQLSFGVRYGGAIGRGIGMGTSSARIFGNISFIETYHSKILFEIGVIGFIAYMAFLTYLLSVLFKDYRFLKDPALRSFASSFWVVMLVITYLPYWYPLDTDPIAVYYWLFAGVILRLPVLEQQERNKPTEDLDNNDTTTVKFKRKKFL